MQGVLKERLQSPPKLKEALGAALTAGSRGREIINAVERGEHVLAQEVRFVSSAINLELGRFRLEWEGQRTTLRDGREVFTPDLAAVKELARLNKDFLFEEDEILKIGPGGRITKLALAIRGLADIEPLSRIPALTELSLMHNNIRDLRPLAGLRELEWLDIANNEVVDLAPLSGLRSLKALYAHENPLTDLSPLAGLPALKCIYLGDCGYAFDLEPLLSLPRLLAVLLRGNGLDGENAVIKQLRKQGVEVGL